MTTYEHEKTVENGFVSLWVLKGYVENCGVAAKFNFAGYDDEAELKKLQAKSKELSDALFASRPCPLQIVERHSNAQSRLAADALRLVERTRDRLRAELAEAKSDMARSLSAGLKSDSQTVRAMCREAINVLVETAFGFGASAYIKQLGRIDNIALHVGQLRGLTHHPAWLQKALDDARPPDAVEKWKSGR